MSHAKSGLRLFCPIPRMNPSFPLRPWFLLGIFGLAEPSVVAAEHAELVAQAQRAPAQLKRRPDGLEEVEAIMHGASVPAWPSAVAFHPDGTRVALLDSEGSLDLWHWQEDRHLRRPIEPSYLYQVAFSRDGTTLIAAEGESGHLYLWNAQNGALRAQRARIVPQWPEYLPHFWLLDNSIVVAPLTDRSPPPPALRQRGAEAPITGNAPAIPALLIEQRDGELVRSWSPPYRPSAMHFNAAGRFVALEPLPAKEPSSPDHLYHGSWAFSRTGRLEIFDYDSGHRRTVLQRPPSAPFSFSSSIDGKLIITWSETRGGGARSEVWDSQTGKRLASLAGEPATLMWSGMSPPEYPFRSGEGRWLLFSQRNRHVLFDAQSYQTTPLRNVGGTAAFAPGTSVVIDAPSACVRAPIMVWNLPASGAPLGRPVALQAPTNPPYPTPPESLRCKERPPAPSELFYIFDHRQHPPRSAAHVGAGLVAVWRFGYGSSGTGGYHAYGPEGDSEIRLFDLATGAVWATLGPHQAPVRFVEFSGDGRLVLTVDAEANMKLWRVQPANPSPPPATLLPPPPEIGWRRY